MNRKEEVQKIIVEVMEATGVTLAELTNPKKGTLKVSDARAAAIFKLSSIGLTVVRIGGIFGGRDHSTISRAISKVYRAKHLVELSGVKS